MAEQVPDIAQLVVDHSRTLKRETPCNNVYVSWKAHRTEHFRPEDTGVSDFDPFFELRMISEDFQGGFRVWVVSWLILQVLDSNFTVESVDHTHKIRQANSAISDESFTLMELGQMSLINSLISEDTVNREVFNRLELLLLGQFVEHL